MRATIMHGSRALLLSAAILVVLGMVVMAAWYVPIEPILRIGTGAAVMRFNTALCFVLLGSALAALGTRHPRFGSIAAGCVVVVGGATLIEHLTGQSVGLDELFCRDFLARRDGGVPGRMAPATALVFVIYSLAILNLAWLRRPGVAALFVAAGLAQALAVLLLYAAGAADSYKHGAYAGMALHTAALFVLIGLALLGTPDIIKLRSFWVPFATATGGIALTIATWFGLTAQDAASLARLLDTHLFSMQEEVTRELETHAKALERMAQRWIVRGGTPQVEWESDAIEYQAALPGLRYLEWVDADGVIRWRVPRSDAAAELGRDLSRSSDSAKTLQQARADSGVIASHTEPIAGAENGFALVIALTRDGALDGYLRAVYSSPDLLRKLLSRQLELGYALRANSAGNSILTHGETSGATQSSALIQWRGLDWQLELFANDVLEHEVASSPTRAVLFGGIAMSMLLAFSLRQLDLARSGRERYELVARGAVDGIWDWNIVAGTQERSARFWQLLGYRPGEITDNYEAWQGLLHPEDRPRVVAAVAAHLEQRVPYDLEYRMKTRDGHYRWYRASGQASWDSAGQPLRMAGSLSDIHEQRTAQDVLRSSEERWKFALEGSGQGVWDWNIESQQVEYSPHALAMLGLPASPTVFPEAHMRGYIHADDVGRVVTLIRRHVAGHTPAFDCEYRLLDENNHSRWIHSRGVVVQRTADGRALRMIGTRMDISSGKQMQEDVRHGNERFELVARGTVDGIWDWDIANGTEAFSERMMELLDRPPGSWQSPDDWTSAVHPDDRSRVQLELTRHLQERRPYEVEYRIATGSGEYRWFAARGQARWDERGKPVRMAGSISDVTQRRQSVEELRNALGAKEVLLKEVYHRVKNNLQVIQSLVSLQARHLPDDATRTAFLETVQRVRAMALVHERLYQSADLVSIEVSGYLRDLLRGIADASGLAARGITLSIDALEVSTNLDAAVPLGLVLNELVQNALKHAFPAGRSGKVEVRLAALEADLVLDVCDDGVGLPDGFDLTRINSMGLQLALRLARQMRGQLSIVPTNGCCLRLRFPHLPD